MIKGQRLYVEHLLFSGWATVVDYYNNEPFRPVAIILDEPDSDGHRHKRVGKDDIVKIKEDE